MEKQSINFFRWIFITAMIPYLAVVPVVPFYILGFSLRGWSWMIMFVLSLITIFRGNKVTMPVWIWLPFIVYILGYNLFDLSFVGVQLSFQYLVSILVGFAASTLIYSDWVVERLYLMTKRFIFTFLAFCMLSLLIFKSTPYAAATVMTLAVFATLFLCYYFRTKKWIGVLGYLGCLFFPVFMVTRMGALAMLLVAVSHFANQNFLKKGFVIAVIAFIGSMVFYSASFQEKSFGKQKGSYEDATMENKKFNSSGRTAIYDQLQPGLKEAPWLGNGPRADLKLLERVGFKIKEVHNDYLAVRYNYGFVGLGFVLLGFLMQGWFLYRKKNYIEDDFTFWMFASAMTLFLPFFALMYTDNILKYSIFFGNYHFAMIGIVYSRLYRNKVIIPEFESDSEYIEEPGLINNIPNDYD